MGRPTAITHADVARRPRRTADLGSKTGVLLTILCILCGLLCFVLCLIAEATRSEVTWVSSPAEDTTTATNSSGSSGSSKYECEYSGSGKTPLVCAATALVGMAAAMLLQHSFMLIAISNTSPPAFVSWEPPFSQTKSLTRQAAAFFVSTWVCFAAAEIMLLIGLSVESGHLKNWSTPRAGGCLAIQQGVFTAAGVFSLVTVFLASGLYVTALRMQWICEEHHTVRREVMEATASAIYLSPPASPPRPSAADERQTSITITPLEFQLPPDPRKLQPASV